MAEYNSNQNVWAPTPESKGTVQLNRTLDKYGNFSGYSGLPYFGGKSTVASIPEYLANPMLFEMDMMVKLSEGRGPNFMKSLLESVFNTGGPKMVKKPVWEYRITREPVQRIYVSSMVKHNNSLTQWKIFIKGSGRDNQDGTNGPKNIRTMILGGSPNQVGDIAKLEPEQFILLMFSYTNPQRTVQVDYKSFSVTKGYLKNLVPEICYIKEINYDKGYIVVDRDWKANKSVGPLVPNKQISITDTAGTDPSTVYIHPDDAFIIPMSKANREDELEGRVRWTMDTFTVGYIQMDSTAYGTRRMAEILSQNLGTPSPYTETKNEALRLIQQRREWTALFSQGSDEFDPQTGLWRGTTDGLLSKIPDQNQILIKGIDYTGLANGTAGAAGTFDVGIFNKFLEDKAWVGNSSHKVIVCGIEFETAFRTMINRTTTAVSEIKSDWAVLGDRYRASNGLTVDILPSDVLNLNGMRDLFFIVDPQYYIMVGLEGYPTLDDIEMPELHPYHKDGYFHSVFGFENLLPEAHYVGRVVSPADWNSEIGASASITGVKASEVE